MEGGREGRKGDKMNGRRSIGRGKGGLSEGGREEREEGGEGRERRQANINPGPPTHLNTYLPPPLSIPSHLPAGCNCMTHITAHYLKSQGAGKAITPQTMPTKGIHNVSCVSVNTAHIHVHNTQVHPVSCTLSERCCMTSCMQACSCAYLLYIHTIYTYT